MLTTALMGSYDIRNTNTSQPQSMASPSSQTSSSKAREYTPEEWEAIRVPFTRLYQETKMKLEDIQREIKVKYHFDATPRQWKRKIKSWGVERNIKTNDSEFMIFKESQRKHEEGKKTTFIVNGHEVTEAKFSRIRRKLCRNLSANKPVYTPKNIMYFTPRNPPTSNSPQQQRRQSQQYVSLNSHQTHLVECFLCNVTTYGQELTIMQAFQSHIASAHPGHTVLRCLPGQDAALVPGAVRTTEQLPSNQPGYVHGVRVEDNSFNPVRLGRLCYVEDQGGGSVSSRRPYLTLTHAESCLTLRADPHQDFHFDSAVPAMPTSPFGTQYPLINDEFDFDFGSNSFMLSAGWDEDNFDSSAAGQTTYFEPDPLWDWPVDDGDWKGAWKQHDGY